MRVDVIGSLPGRPRRVACVLADFPEELPKPAHGPIKRLFLTCVGSALRARIVDHDRAMAVYFANPRPAAYGVATMLAVAERLAPEARLNVLATAGHREALSRLPSDTAIEIVENGGILVDQVRRTLSERRPDAVLLVYPDALGLGQEALETSVCSLGVPVVVANGRRRALVMTEADRTFLARHRRAALARDTELLLAGAAVVLGAAGALIDRFRRKGGALVR